jgi:hypothetical protein
VTCSRCGVEIGDSNSVVGITQQVGRVERRYLRKICRGCYAGGLRDGRTKRGRRHKLDARAAYMRQKNAANLARREAMREVWRLRRLREAA